MRSRIAGVIAAALLVLAACGGTQPAATQTKAAIPFALGYPAPAASFTPYFVAKDLGFFKRNGLNVSLKLLSGSATETPALLSGSVQVVIIDANLATGAIAKGAKVALVGNDLNEFPFELWAKPSIHSVTDLKGKRLGLLHVASGSDVAAHELLPKFGMSFKDVKAEYLGAPPIAVAALIAGKVPAVISDPPSVFKAKENGFRLVYDLSKLQHVSHGFLMTRAFVQKHPGEVTDFLKSYVEAAAFLKNPSNEAKVVKAIANHTKTKAKKLLDESYKFFAPRFQCDPQVTAADLASSIQWVRQHDNKTVAASSVLDMGPLHSLEKSGFVKKYCK